jgi:hypothetical protein
MRLCGKVVYRSSPCRQRICTLPSRRPDPLRQFLLLPVPEKEGSNQVPFRNQTGQPGPKALDALSRGSIFTRPERAQIHDKSISHRRNQRRVRLVFIIKQAPVGGHGMQALNRHSGQAMIEMEREQWADYLVRPEPLQCMLEPVEQEIKKVRRFAFYLYKGASRAEARTQRQTATARVLKSQFVNINAQFVMELATSSGHLVIFFREQHDDATWLRRA